VGGGGRGGLGGESLQKEKQRLALSAKLNRGVNCVELAGGVAAVLRDILESSSASITRPPPTPLPANQTPLIPEQSPVLLQTSPVISGKSPFPALSQKIPAFAAAAEVAGNEVVVLELDPEGERLESFLFHLRSTWWPQVSSVMCVGCAGVSVGVCVCVYVCVCVCVCV